LKYIIIKKNHNLNITFFVQMALSKTNTVIRMIVIITFINNVSGCQDVIMSGNNQ